MAMGETVQRAEGPAEVRRTLLAACISVTTGCESGQAEANSTEPAFVPAKAAVQEGATCSLADSDASQMDCTYTVGKGLKFVIAGVGQDDSAISIDRALGMDSDYYFTFGVLHGCVIVKSNIAAAARAGAHFDMAFVSPKTGKVYDKWQECRETNRKLVP